MSRIKPASRALGFAAALLSGMGTAKPIAFQGGHTLMFEYGAGTLS